MNNGGIYMTALRPENEAATGAARFGIFWSRAAMSRMSAAGASPWAIPMRMHSFRARRWTRSLAAYGHENIVIRDNYVKAAGGDGITVMYALRPLVEHNTADSVACEMNDRIYSEPGNRLGKVAAASGRGSARTRGSVIMRPLTPASIRTAWPTMRTPATARCMSTITAA